MKFQKFVRKEIVPLVKNYRPLNNKEEWYIKWDLIPYEDIDPDTYMKKLLEIRKDPAVTWQFKTFLLQLASKVYYGFLKPQETKEQSH